jgi:hypothetical protein
MKRIIGLAGMKLGSWKFKVTVGIRNIRESAHMAYLTNPISQPGLDISPIWIPLISKEVTNSQRRSV